MLETEVLGAVQPSEAAATRAERQAALGRDDFLRMLVAQLENQDPLNPQDGTEFTAQLATFSSLEQLISMRTGIDALVAQLGEGGSTGGLSGVASDLLAAGVIGKDVLAAGSQFALTASGAGGGFDPASGRLPLLSFDLAGNTASTQVRIVDAAGQPRATLDLGRLDQGRHELTPEQLGGALAGLPAGNYHFEVDARFGEREIGATRFTGGRVTATSHGGEQPLLLLGGAAVPVSDVVEIREPGPGA